MIPSQETINRALLGDAEAARVCTEAGCALPCPFCGRPADTSCDSNEYGAWQGVCIERGAACYATAGWHNSEKEALASWNTRVDLTHLATPNPINESEEL